MTKVQSEMQRIFLRRTQEDFPRDKIWNLSKRELLHVISQICYKLFEHTTIVLNLKIFTKKCQNIYKQGINFTKLSPTTNLSNKCHLNLLQSYYRRIHTKFGLKDVTFQQNNSCLQFWKPIKDKILDHIQGDNIFVELFRYIKFLL